MGTLFFVAAAMAISTILICLLADWLFPRVSSQRFALICGLIIPGVLLLLYPVAMLWIGMTAHPDAWLDVHGMTLVVISGLIAFSCFVGLVTGMPVAAMNLNFLRKKT
jgi:hypothetical protein